MARVIGLPDHLRDRLAERPDGTALVPAWVERDGASTLVAELSDLDPLARILATTDGTVTEILEAWADDSIAVGQLSQREGYLPHPLAVLDASAASPVLRRDVLLVGARSRRPLLYAESLILTGRLPAPIRDGLRQGGTPIGKLLRSSRLETYREFLHLARASAGPLAPRFLTSSADDLIERIYRIFAGGRPIMVINEKFPVRTAPRPIA